MYTYMYPAKCIVNQTKEGQNRLQDGHSIKLTKPTETNRQVGLPTGLDLKTETQSDKLTQTQMQTDTLYTLHILYYLDSYDDRTL